MTEKTAPWWRSFVGKRRKAARESAAILEQDLRNQASAGSTPQHPSAEPDQQLSSPAKEAGNCLPNEETYDDATVQPTFNEGSNRRNLLVSRSGRFKEKRKTRASFPQNHEDDGNLTAAKSTDVQSTH